MKILYANDIHYSASSKPLFSKSVEAVPKFFELIKSVKDDIDLLIINGDLSDYGSADELEQIKKAIDAAGVPYQVVAGNHDLAREEEIAIDRSVENSYFGRLFGPESVRRVIDCGWTQLVFFSIIALDPDANIQWLKKVLSSKKPSLLFCHYPLLPLRTNGFGKTWGFDDMPDVRRQLIELIKEYGDNIPAYFCGHHHINSRVKFGKTEQIATGAAGVSTCCYKRIDIQNSKIVIRTEVLPGITEWLADAMNPPESLDEEHPTVEVYHWGNDSERNFTIEYAR
jgi:Calcineurin-like phosphoesterase